MDNYVKNRIRSLLEKKQEYLASLINKQIKKLNQSKERPADNSEKIAAINLSIENFIKALATAEPRGGAYGIITLEIEKLTKERIELQAEESKSYFNRPVPYITSNTVINGLIYYLELIEKNDFNSWREIIRDFVKEIKAGNEQITVCLRLNPLIRHYTKEEILFDITKDRDSIILGNRKKPTRKYI